MAGISISMNCPSCGGTQSIAEGMDLITCPFCSALLAVAGDQSGIRKVTLKSVLSREQAIDAVGLWWTGRHIASDVGRQSRITEAFLIYVPFWKMTAKAAGWVCGIRSKDQFENMVYENYVWTEVACDVGEFGVRHLKNVSGEAVFYEDGSVPVLEITDSYTDAMARCIETIRSEAICGTAVDAVFTFKHIEVLPGDFGIVYYPVWVVRYTYCDRVYPATVDGMTGEMLAGRAPGDSLSRSLALAIGMGVSVMGSFFLLWLAIAIFQAVTLSDANEVQIRYLGYPIFVVVGLLIGALACLSLVVGPYWLFRYGSEIQTGDIKGGYDPASATRMAMESVKNLLRTGKWTPWGEEEVAGDGRDSTG